MNKEDMKSLSLCNKRIYKKYCEQIQNIKINLEDPFELNSIDIKKYENIRKLDLNSNFNEIIKDFSFISYFKNLEELHIIKTKISDISFLKTIKILKYLN